MQRAITIVLAGALLVLTVGCTGSGYLQVRPERLYERWPNDDASYRKVGELDLTMRSFVFLGIPLAIPNVVATIDSRIQEANADAVVNLEVDSIMGMLYPIFGLGTYTARGDLVRFE